MGYNHELASEDKDNAMLYHIWIFMGIPNEKQFNNRTIGQNICFNATQIYLH